jgi:uncharacterized membrane protein
MVEKHFRWRGTEMTRIEAFTDAVFAFAVTLLVVALEVPHSFSELVHAMQGFAAFAVCFSLLTLVWMAHSNFFRRYGLQTTTANVLNSALLFVVLFYVYPLKFLFTMLFSVFFRGETPDIHGDQVSTLMIVYGLGFAAVFLILALLHLHAYRLRHELDLNEVEVYLTKRELINNIAMMSFGLVSSLLAALLPSRLAGIAGWLYAGIGIYHSIAGATMGKRQRLLCEKMERLQREASAAATSA